MLVKLMLSGQTAGDGWLPSTSDIKGYMEQLRQAALSGDIAASELRVLGMLYAVWPHLPEPHQRRTALRLVANGWAGDAGDLLMVVKQLAV